MRVACPACSAAYDVPDSLVTPGRAVRCSRCGMQWIPVMAPEPEPEPKPPPPPAEPQPVPAPAAQARAAAVAPVRQSAMDRLAAYAARPEPLPLLRVAWAASIAVLVLLVLAALVWRSEIVAAWPPSARAYALFGLQPVTGADR